MDTLPEKIEHNNKILALVVRAKVIKNFKEKMLFVSPSEFPFQLGLHCREDSVEPHFHLPFSELKNFPVQEFFYVLSGKIKVDLYDERKNDAKVKEVFLGKGDSILLNTGHGFTFLEKAKVIEIKQGPYRGREQEKRFISGD